MSCKVIAESEGFARLSPRFFVVCKWAFALLAIF
jgi:hypothetical protein